MHHSRSRALIRRYRFDIPGYQDGCHDIDGSGRKMVGFTSSVRIALREVVAKRGLILVGPHDPPSRNGLQVIRNRIVFEPFLESRFPEKIRGDVLLAKPI